MEPQGARSATARSFEAYQFIQRLIQMHMERQEGWKRTFLLPDLKLSFTPHQLCLWPRIPDACAGLCISTPPHYARELQDIINITGGVIPITRDEMVRVCLQASKKQQQGNQNNDG